MEDFFSISAGLKKIPRQGWIDKAGITNPESVADHAYSTAIMAMVLGDTAGMNSSKMIKMALLHDLAESVTGDMTPEMAKTVDKTDVESKAMNKILGTLPEQLRDEYHAIWAEYSKGESAESKMMHEIDKLEMALQASIYANDGASSRKNLQEFMDAAKDAIRDPKLKSILESFTK